MLYVNDQATAQSEVKCREVFTCFALHSCLWHVPSVLQRQEICTTIESKNELAKQRCHCEAIWLKAITLKTVKHQWIPLSAKQLSLLLSQLVCTIHCFQATARRTRAELLLLQHSFNSFKLQGSIFRQVTCWQQRLWMSKTNPLIMRPCGSSSITVRNDRIKLRKCYWSKWKKMRKMLGGDACHVILCNSGYTHLASHTKTLPTEPALNRCDRNNWCAGWRVGGERPCGRRQAAVRRDSAGPGRSITFASLRSHIEMRQSAALCERVRAGVDSLQEGVMSVSPSHPAKHKHSCVKASAILPVQSYRLHSCFSFCLCSAGQFLREGGES